MRKLAYYLTAFAIVFLAPWFAGVVARWVVYGFTDDPRGTLMGWAALAAWGVAAVIRRIWREKPEAAA